MPTAHLHKPHRPAEDAPDESEPISLPVEPDKGPIPAVIPDDPEHERLLGPEDSPQQEPATTAELVVTGRSD